MGVEVELNGRSMAARIQRRRDELGLTQLELARRVGTTRTTISRWETGRSRPRGHNRLSLEAALWRTATAEDAPHPEEPTRLRGASEEFGGADPGVVQNAPPDAEPPSAPFVEAALAALKNGYVRDARWIAVSNELARVKGLSWHVEDSTPED